MSAPVDYTNDIRSDQCASDNFISINNAVDLDLFGQVNAETAGIKHISGAGGQLRLRTRCLSFQMVVRVLSAALPLSQTNRGNQLKSRIPSNAESNGSVVTDTRANIHYLVTEYGKVNLKGLSTWQKAEAIISVAHPDFRDELIKEAEKMHIWRRSNK